MTATEELRRMLDERGVEWASICGDVAWFDSSGWTVEAVADSVDGTMLYVEALMTPAQAVEATLGRETCSIVKTWSDSDYDEDWRYRCSECGAFIGVYERVPETGCPVDHDNYCPNCGRKVVDG